MPKGKPRNPRPPVIGRFMRQIAFEPNSGCWLWLGGIGEGYGKISIDGINYSAHRVAYQLFKNELIPDGMCVLHKCDVRSCVNPDHLCIGTHTDNIRDAINKRRLTWKLEDTKVRAIRDDNRAATTIAKDYGVCERTVHSVKSRQTWKRVEQ